MIRVWKRKVSVKRCMGVPLKIELEPNIILKRDVIGQ